MLGLFLKISYETIFVKQWDIIGIFLLFNSLLFTYRSTQLKNFLSWGSSLIHGSLQKQPSKIADVGHFSRKWLGPYGSSEKYGENFFHKYLFAGIKSWWNEMSFKCKVFWINSILSEARKVNLTILKIKLFSNTKCLKNALFDKLLVS